MKVRTRVVFQREGKGEEERGREEGRKREGGGGERDINKQKCKKQAVFETLR